MTHFRTNVLDELFPRSVVRNERTLSNSRDFRERVPDLRDVGKLRTEHGLPGSRNEEQTGNLNCVVPRQAFLSPPVVAA